MGGALGDPAPGIRGRAVGINSPRAGAGAPDSGLGEGRPGSGACISRGEESLGPGLRDGERGSQSPTGRRKERGWRCSWCGRRAPLPSPPVRFAADGDCQTADPLPRGPWRQVSPESAAEPARRCGGNTPAGPDGSPEAGGRIRRSQRRGVAAAGPEGWRGSSATALSS